MLAREVGWVSLTLPAEHVSLRPTVWKEDWVGLGCLDWSPHLEELSLGKACEAVACLGLRAEQQVVQGDPHLSVQLAQFLLLRGGHCLPTATLKLLQLA